MHDAHLNNLRSSCLARPVSRPFRLTVLTGFWGMVILMPLQLSAAELLPRPLDTTQIMRLAYPGGVLPNELRGGVDAEREKLVAPSPPAAALSAFDTSAAAGSSAESGASDAAMGVAMPDDADAPEANQSTSVSSAPRARPDRTPTSAPTPLNKDVIASLASGGQQAPGKPVEPPPAIIPRAATAPDSPAQQPPPPRAPAPETESKSKQSPEPPVATIHSQSPQQAVLPGALQHKNMPQRQSAPPGAMRFSRSQHPSMMPPAAIPHVWPQQQGMPPVTMWYIWPQQQSVPQPMHPYGRPVQLPITRQQLDVLLNVFGPALHR